MTRKNAKTTLHFTFPAPGARPLFAPARFLRGESGAVTVDFTVLLAAVVMLGMSVAITVGSGTMDQADDVTRCLRIQSKLMARDIDYDKRLKREARRCSKQ